MIQRGFEVVPELLRLLRSQANDLWKAGVRSELPWSRSVRMPFFSRCAATGVTTVNRRQDATPRRPCPTVSSALATREVPAAHP